MRRQNWHPSASERICESHFLPSDYSYPPSMPNSESLGKKYLKKDAVPSLFSFPEHLKRRSPKKRVPVKRSNPAPPQTPPALDPKHVKLDHKYATTASPRKIKAHYEKKLNQKRKTINRLRAKNFRKQKTIKGLMFKLRTLKLFSEENQKSLTDNFGHMATELFKNQEKLQQIIWL